MELLVKVLKPFETAIYLLVYRKCFKWRGKKKKNTFQGAERRREFHVQLNVWPGSILSTSSLIPTTGKAAWLVEMRFPAAEGLRSKSRRPYLGVGISGSSSSFFWPSLAKMQPLEGAEAQDSQNSPAWLPANWGFVESLCSWHEEAGGSWRWVLGGVGAAWRGNTVLCTLSIPPARVPPASGPSHHFPKAFSKVSYCRIWKQARKTKLKLFWRANDKLSSAFFLHWWISS